MSIFKSKQDNFSIDDAFLENSEDKIRLYSNSSETAPLTETIYEEQEPPDFEGSSLTLSPTQSNDSPFSSEAASSNGEPPIIKTKSILKNPTLQALKEKEEKDVSSSREIEIKITIYLSILVNIPGFCIFDTEPRRLLCRCRASQVLVETPKNQGELENRHSRPDISVDRSR